ncbi:hypothetical protein ACPESV_40200 [Streptomyces umbrinus]|uniref:hypothetical protein n=1 Tax=Streptomyces umbrinus TaxID=67370 RepID=UPI003C2BC1BE
MSGAHDDTFGITEQDFDDLVASARAAGEEVQELETAKAALYGPGTNLRSAQARGWKLKLLIAMLRHGGEALAKWLRRLSPKAADYVRRYAKKLADFLETAENWAQAPIIAFLMAKGVPHAEAAAIAGLIVLFIG